MKTHGITFEGAALSVLCGASLGLGYNLLRFDSSNNKDEKAANKNTTLAESSLRAGLGGAIFNLGLYLVAPTWLRKLWLYDGTN